MTKLNPFFEVRQERLHTESGIDTGRYAVLNDETNDLLGIITEKYEIVKHEKINNLFFEAISPYWEIENVIDHLNHDTSRWQRDITFKNPELEYEVQKGDITKVQLSIFNGYSGKVSFGYVVSGLRLVCTNGMKLPGKLWEQRISHFDNAVQKIQDNVNEKFNQFGSVIGNWQDWAISPFSHDDFIEFVDEFEEIPERTRKNLVEHFPYVKNKEKYPTETKWLAFNTLTSFDTHLTKGSKGSSNVFSKGHKDIGKIIQGFYELN